MFHFQAASAIVALASSTALVTAQSSSIDVLAAGNVTLQPGPLVVPPSNLEARSLGGQPRIDNDANWYTLGRVPFTDPNNPLEFTRDAIMLRNGVPFIREGLQLPGSPDYLPIGDLPFSQTPWNDIALASDGTVAQVIFGTDNFGLLPDGTPVPDSRLTANDPAKGEAVVLDRTVILRTGETTDLVPGVVAPNNRFDLFFSAKPASATRLLIDGALSEAGNFTPDTRIIFEIQNLGLASESRELRFTTDNNNPLPDLGFNLSNINVSEEDVDYNADGSILLGIDIEGEPFNTDGAIVLYNGPLDEYQLLAREGQPSPLPGRQYDSLFNNPVALNDAGNVAFLASVNGDFNTDGIIVVDGQVIAQEGMPVGTAAPGTVQLGSANANIQMDHLGNIIWYGAWNKPKAELCPDNPDITSSFAIFEGLFFNDQLLIEGGVTEINNVNVDGTVFPTLIVADLPNTAFGGFRVSPNGRWLITQALLAEPNEDVCAFSINNDETAVVSAVLRIDLDAFRSPGCNAADTTAPFGTLDASDLNAVVAGIIAFDPAFDIEPDGVVNYFDLVAALDLFDAGCP